MTDLWLAVRWLHVLAMAFFVGGQLLLAAAVVPVVRGADDRTVLRAVARRFGYGSLIALGVLVITGSAMASHYALWSDHTLWLKLALVVCVIALVVWHMRRPAMHVLEALVFLVSLAIVWLGLSLAYG